MRDFRKYPELIWLDRHYTLPGVGLAFLCLCGMGWQGLVWGFFVSTVLCYHGRSCHQLPLPRFRLTSGTPPRYEPQHSSALASLTLGEGWHNNHHHYHTSANQGFYSWELDISYYGLLLLSSLGLVWDLKKPSQRALEAAQR